MTWNIFLLKMPRTTLIVSFQVLPEGVCLRAKPPDNCVICVICDRKMSSNS